MLKQKLDQKQVQKLILAPALQQAIRLLPLTNLELIEVIDAELSQNPVLEEASGETSLETGEEEAVEEKEERGEFDLNGEEKNPLELENNEGDAEWETVFREYLDESLPPSGEAPEKSPSLENILARGPSLWDHLHWQANLTFFEPEEKEIAASIIGNINEDGYLTFPVEEIASSLAVSIDKVEAVRQKIKGFDPIGSGSLSLKEMLLAQMDHLGLQEETTRRIVEEYMPFLEKADYEELGKKLGISLAEVKHHLEVIRHLDPAPGRKYAQEKIVYVVPDIIVVKEEDDYRVILNNEGLPRLRINNYYRQMLASGPYTNPEAYAYLKEQMKRALWFLKSLHQREQTVYRVARAIINRQKDFLEKGIDFLQPLTLAEIAAEIGVHESTVGRVVANKYIQTPRGVFSLRYFFHKSLTGKSGEEISCLRIKEKIKKLIEAEDPARPLSDTELSDILARENIKIARRTVAKYRQQLKILPSDQRKKKFFLKEEK